MTEEHIKDQKYVCPACGFENSIPGYCPMDDENYMKKVCECDSGMYASQCCEPELETREKEMEKAIEQELNQELEKEITESMKEEKAQLEQEESDTE
jgi:hypothetical protein